MPLITLDICQSNIEKEQRYIQNSDKFQMFTSIEISV
jgi:hypothetical protein